ncbi:MarR family transcriptional regulator [Paremcibacter congregatus]|uniref:MarR family transcriptional regulator n=2 Tax=Paremcibacter congregatus TaxID=2043170 RepID=A0A2G4YRN3_9PROT|nr:MarR family transcriptional regulator [Paremcibacter congregatus]QDE26035.1 winged helix-turn-helix transcriptional regulator [Paremcibacter congregatus]
MEIVKPRAESQSLNESLEMCVCTQVRRAARAITRLYDDALNETGIRYTQMIILMVLHKHEGITVSGLADELLMDASTVARNLRPLEKQELITIMKGKDRRQRLLALSQKGIEAVEEGVKYWRVAQSKISSNFSEQQFRSHIEAVAALEVVATNAS